MTAISTEFTEKYVSVAGNDLSKIIEIRCSTAKHIYFTLHWDAQRILGLRTK